MLDIVGMVQVQVGVVLERWVWFWRDGHSLCGSDISRRGFGEVGVAGMVGLGRDGHSSGEVGRSVIIGARIV